MKKFFIVLTILTVSLGFSQNKININKFEALDSNVGATIRIVKSPDYGIALADDRGNLDAIGWEVSDETLKLKSDNSNIDFSQTIITIYTPSISVVGVADGGILTMDTAFSQIESFVVSAVGDATVDLSNIDFKNLVANATTGGKVIYRSTRNLVSSTDEGGRISRAAGVN
ncbi:GIN domain-containing protein [Spongiimicrobium sp. 3-5]|uniref:GIN domain-containing protein n=1 Tax=Spongiimicrobium sp. 3-5 TaxID=3332596 RepID=UPI00397EDBA2